MTSPSRLLLVAMGALALAGCQTTGAPQIGAVSKINGQPLPAKVQGLVNVTTMIDTVDVDGKRLVVTKGTRKAGTRVAIHVHKFGGHTCVLTGEITGFMEGMPIHKYPAGTCYYMPPNVPMAASNLGKTDVVLIDTFVLPPGEPTITIIEPGQQP